MCLHGVDMDNLKVYVYIETGREINGWLDRLRDRQVGRKTYLKHVKIVSADNIGLSLAERFICLPRSRYNFILKFKFMVMILNWKTWSYPALR